MTDLRLSRRAVTRALATLPIIAVPAIGRAGAATKGENAMNMQTQIRPAVSADRSAWDAAMRKWQEAKAMGHSVDAAYVYPLQEAEQAAFGKQHIYPDDCRFEEVQAWRAARNGEAIYDRYEQLGNAEADAQVALLRTPAPDAAALRWKLDQTIEEDGEIALWCEDIALSIQADYRRLLPAEARS